jgi:O-antigen ligase
MQDLRQGEGIIDIINTYVQVLLDNGFVGLTLFLSFILICLFKAWRTSRRSRLMDPDFSLLGCSITACILGLLLMLADASFEAGPERIFYALAGVATAYAHVDRLQLLITRRADSA